MEERMLIVWVFMKGSLEVLLTSDCGINDGEGIIILLVCEEAMNGRIE